jgi:hypothetical protein
MKQSNNVDNVSEVVPMSLQGNIENVQTPSYADLLRKYVHFPVEFQVTSSIVLFVS